MRTWKACQCAAQHPLRTQVARSSRYLASVPLAPPDMILGCNKMYAADLHPKKVNLAVGVYRDAHGKPYVLDCVKQAALKVLEDVQMDYAPINGLASFHESARRVCFGDALDNEYGKTQIATVQTCSGTGALRLAADLLCRFGQRTADSPQGKIVVYVPSPTYPNHLGVFREANLEIAYYPYYSHTTHSVDADAMLASLRTLAPNTVIVLHACAHNPTGADPTRAQWDAILDVCDERELVPFVDMAYQGFCTGDLEEDGYLPRALCRRGTRTFFVAQSFAKSMGLYGQRTGALHVFCRDADERTRVLSQTAAIARPMYSNPPIFGARVVDEVVRDPALTELWHKELQVMAHRMVTIRRQLVAQLAAVGSTRDWSHLTRTRGMMALAGLAPQQVEALRNDHHIYMIPSGRIAFSGLTDDNVEYVAAALHQVVK